MIDSRDNDYEHYLKCGNCGWEGWAAWMRHGYQAYGHGENADVEPMDFCPKCGESEECAEVYITCYKACNACLDKFVCYTALTRIPVDMSKFYRSETINLV